MWHVNILCIYDTGVALVRHRPLFGRRPRNARNPRPPATVPHRQRDHVQLRQPEGREQVCMIYSMWYDRFTINSRASRQAAQSMPTGVRACLCVACIRVCVVCVCGSLCVSVCLTICCFVIFICFIPFAWLAVCLSLRTWYDTLWKKNILHLFIHCQYCCKIVFLGIICMIITSYYWTNHRVLSYFREL